MADFRWFQGYIEPVEGMGATALVFLDGFAFTVVEVSARKKTIRIQRDRATLLSIDAEVGAQVYRVETDPNGRILKASYRGNAGRWYGEFCAFHLGYRKEFRSRYAEPPGIRDGIYCDPYSGAMHRRSSSGWSRLHSAPIPIVAARMQAYGGLWDHDLDTRA